MRSTAKHIPQRRTDTGCAPDKPGHSPDALCTPAVRAPKAQGMLSSPQIISSVPICFLHFFDSWKQHRSGEGGWSRPHSSRRVAVGANRRALTGLPRSVNSPAKKWEITRSRSRPVFPARRFSSVCPLPQRRVLCHRGSGAKLRGLSAGPEPHVPSAY
jgi:hypothetical protein